LIVLADVRRIEKRIEAQLVRLDRDDGKSVRKWTEQLESEGSLLGFKSVSCPVPTKSGLADEVFLLAIQTKAQQTLFREFGNTLAFIDGTHNTTMYENMVLTTIIVRDNWGHGIPAAWMLASSGTQETISFFLSLVRGQNPSVIPWRIMSDRDLAQINACQLVYPETCVILCWWHVLHAWQQHFVISAHPELWKLLKAWIRITEPKSFEATWIKIQSLAPPRFIQYLKEHWMPGKYLRMWSGMYRVERGVYELSDTNMLVEA